MQLEIMEKILQKIKEYDRILIFRHFRPDGDAVGSTKGLQEILRITYPEKEIYLANNDFAKYLEKAASPVNAILVIAATILSSGTYFTRISKIPMSLRSISGWN